MNTFGLWVIIFSAVTMAGIVSATIGMLATSTKWYRKWVARVSWKYTEEILNMDKTSEDTDEVKIEKDIIEE